MINVIKKRLDEYNMCYTENNIAHGIQLKLANGATVNVYNTNKVLVQGKQPIKSKTEELLGLNYKLVQTMDNDGYLRDSNWRS